MLDCVIKDEITASMKYLLKQESDRFEGEYPEEMRQIYHNGVLDMYNIAMKIVSPNKEEECLKTKNITKSL